MVYVHFRFLVFLFIIIFYVFFIIIFGSFWILLLYNTNLNVYVM